MAPLQITIAVLVLVIVAFLTGKVPYSIICIGIMVIFVSTKVLSASEAFGSFANTNVIMFGAMFVVGAGITKTSLLGRIKKLVIGYKDRPRAIMALACIASTLVAHPNSELSANMQEKDVSSKLSPAKEKIALVVIVATILCMLFYKQIGVAMYVSACVGAALLVITGVLSENEAIGSFHMPTIFLFAGVLTLSSAISSTDAGTIVADLIIKIIGNSTNPYVIMAAFFIVPLILTQLMSNLATITIFIPLAAVTAVQIGIDPRAAVMGTLIAGCASILTPMASPVQAMIMGPGKYKMTDFLKSGLPITIVITIVSIIWLPLLYPFN